MPNNNNQSDNQSDNQLDSIPDSLPNIYKEVDIDAVLDSKSPVSLPAISVDSLITLRAEKLIAEDSFIVLILNSISPDFRLDLKPDQIDKLCNKFYIHPAKLISVLAKIDKKKSGNYQLSLSIYLEAV